MSEEREIRASREDVERFVGELKGFYGTLGPTEQHMMAVILEGAQAKDTGGYGWNIRRYGEPDEGSSSESQAEGWNDLIGWIEEQGEEDTQGFGIRYR